MVVIVHLCQSNVRYFSVTTVSFSIVCLTPGNFETNDVKSYKKL
jgi:hypothetical protein